MRRLTLGKVRLHGTLFFKFILIMGHLNEGNLEKILSSNIRVEAYFYENLFALTVGPLKPSQKTKSNTFSSVMTIDNPRP